MPHRLLASIALLFSLLTAQPAQAQSQDELRQLLQTPGVHAIMRHALAPGTGDPAQFDIDDCSTQRNLDDRGRAQSRATGQAFRDLGARFDTILTSQWCRCKETAALLNLGAPVEAPMLNSFFEDRSTAAEQTRALGDHLAGLPSDQRVMYVTHQVNITALTGRGVSSGEVFLIRANSDGDATVLGSFLLPPD